MKPSSTAKGSLRRNREIANVFGTERVRNIAFLKGVGRLAKGGVGIGEDTA